MVASVLIDGADRERGHRLLCLCHGNHGHSGSVISIIRNSDDTLDR